MHFASYTFLLFLVLCVLAHRMGDAWKSDKAAIAHQNWVGIIFSCVFFAWAGLYDFLLFVASCFGNYLISFHIRRGRAVLIGALAANLAVLVYHKYLVMLLATTGFVPVADGLDIVLPIGISFYTFQFIAYQIDISRGHAQVKRSFPKFFLFAIFFGHLLAGPIMRAHEFIHQFDRRRAYSADQFEKGLLLLFWGLFKKVASDKFVSPYVDTVFANPNPDFWSAWIGTFSFSFQIYLDFSGYCDIALGVGLLLGVRLRRNFFQPYLARNPSEFWRRWHITLSEWIRDYIYIPLGGSRNGNWRTVSNLMITMGLGGLWHGANWTFAAWGLAHGALLVFHRTIGRKIPAPRWLAVLATFTAANVIWVFFRADTFAQASAILSALVDVSSAFEAEIPWRPTAIVIALYGLHMAEEFALTRRTALYPLLQRIPAFFWGGGLAVVASAVFLIMSRRETVAPFIYFRF